MSVEQSQVVAARDVLEAGARSTVFFGRHWFPKTFRQASPEYHTRVFDSIENPNNRFIAWEIFRDGAKTTLARVIAAKRIAYAVSHTIIYLSRSQKHALTSIDWLRNQVEYNRGFAEFFRLRKGRRWTGEDIEIIHGIDEYPIRVVALGITGQIRGFNFDDFRPDFIVADDVDDEETTGTLEQREKTSELFFGALLNSLAPQSEAPLATAALLQTPLHKYDLVETCQRDPSWAGGRIGIFNESGKSVWPQRYPTEQLLKDKESAIARNQLHIWMREKECQIVPATGRALKLEWLRYHDGAPEGSIYLIVIDPATEKDRKEGSQQVISCLAMHGPNIYVEESIGSYSWNPDEVISEVFRMYMKYRPVLAIGVESVAYQKTLKWYLKKKMYELQMFPIIHEISGDKRDKNTKIIHAIGLKAPTGNLYVKRDQHQLLSQYGDIPNDDPNDYIDCVAMGIKMAADLSLSTDAVGYEQAVAKLTDSHLPPLDYHRGAP